MSAKGAGPENIDDPVQRLPSVSVKGVSLEGEPLGRGQGVDSVIGEGPEHFTETLVTVILLQYCNTTKYCHCR